MVPRFKSFIEFVDTFKSNEYCIAHAHKIRFESQIYCPFCNSKKANYDNIKAKYICGKKRCRKEYNSITNTIFESSEIPIREMFSILYLISIDKDMKHKTISQMVGTNPTLTKRFINKIKKHI